MTTILEKTRLETCPKNVPEKRARSIFDHSYTIFGELGRGRWEGGELGRGRWVCLLIIYVLIYLFIYLFIYYYYYYYYLFFLRKSANSEFHNFGRFFA